jgi:hypothetical protein
MISISIIYKYLLRGDLMSFALFEKVDSFRAFESEKEAIKRILRGLKDEEILPYDIEELTEYYTSKYELLLFDVEFDKPEQKIEKKIIQIPGRDMLTGGSKYYDVDGYKITFTIYYNGDSDLLVIRPSSFMVTRIIADYHQPPKGDMMGHFIFSIELREEDLQNKENPQDFIDSEYNKLIKSFRSNINSLNTNIEQFNASLKSIIKPELVKRKKALDKHNDLMKKLKIPLEHRSEIQGTVRKIKLHKKRVIKPEKTTAVMEYSYEITQDDYNDILTIIKDSSFSMEKSARTFYKFSEEELRDVLLTNLNSHYKGLVDGESFSKIGKTDIRVYFEGKSAFIGECKIWHGEKEFTKALEQLSSYATWKDSKNSLIMFNKNNKDYNNTLKAITDCIQNDPRMNKVINLKPNEWDVVFRKSEENTEEMNIRIFIFDFYIGEK